MQLRVLGAVLASLLMMTGIFAQPSTAYNQPVVAYAQPNQPFTPSLFAQLNLTPDQSATAAQISNAVNQSLMVGIYPTGEHDNYLGNYAVVIPVDQLIAIRQQQLTAQLASPHPDPVLISNLADNINSLQQNRQSVIAAAYTTVYAMLTPNQRVRLPQLATLLQQPAG